MRGADAAAAESYDAWALRLRIERLRLVVPVASVASVGLAIATAVAWDRSLARAVCSLGAALAIGGAALVSSDQRTPQPNPVRLAVVLSLVASALCSAAFAARFGGIGGVAGGVVLMSWVFAAVVAPRRLVWLPIVLTLHAGTFLMTAWLLTKPAKPPFGVMAVLATGIGIVTSGAARRQRHDRQDFEAWARLDHTLLLVGGQRAVLQRATEDLQQTARAQVAETLAHATTTRALEEKLSERVAARSRELVNAVDRVSSPMLFVASAIVRDTMVGPRARTIDRMSPAPYDPSFLANDLSRPGAKLLVSVIDLEGPEPAARLERALELSSRVAHPSLAAVVDRGLLGDRSVYIAADHEPGTPLFRAMSRPDVTLAEGVRIAHAIATALAAAHAQSVWHLGLDLNRVLLHTKDSGITIHGVGLVQAWTEATGSPPSRTSTVRSTPAYQAPEQCSTEPLDTPAADAYALGLLLFESVAKLHPLVAGVADQAGGAGRVLRKLQPEAPQALATLVHAMLAHEPSSRPSMEQIEAQLAEIAELLEAPPASEIGARLRVLRPADDGTAL